MNQETILITFQILEEESKENSKSYEFGKRLAIGYKDLLKNIGLNIKPDRPNETSRRAFPKAIPKDYSSLNVPAVLRKERLSNNA